MSGNETSSVGEYVTWEGQKEILYEYLAKGMSAMKATLDIYFTDETSMIALRDLMLQRCEEGYITYGHRIFEKSVINLTTEFCEEIADALAYMIISSYVATERGLFAPPA